MTQVNDATGHAPAETGGQNFHLNTHLPYLLARATGRIASEFSQRTAEVGLTLKMWRVLTVLSEYPELRLSDIAHLTAIEVSTLSRMVSAMHKRRLIARRRSTKSKREIVVSLAPAGIDCLNHLIPLAQQFEEAILVGVDPAEIDTTKIVLRQVFDNLVAMAPVSGASVNDSLLKAL